MKRFPSHVKPFDILHLTTSSACYHLYHPCFSSCSLVVGDLGVEEAVLDLPLPLRVGVGVGLVVGHGQPPGPVVGEVGADRAEHRADRRAGDVPLDLRVKHAAELGLRDLGHGGRHPGAANGKNVKTLHGRGALGPDNAPQMASLSAKL